MIEILDDTYSALNLFLKAKKPSLLIIITDENTHEHCLPLFLSNLETDSKFEIIELDAGEEMKTWESAGTLLEIFTEFNADRNALVVNLGGGVISDLGGFAASVYKRGLSFINIPTSLLGMCDASIGGKTGVDLLQIKNVVGTFALPEKIFLDTSYLKTLPHIQIISGFAEMLKHGLVADRLHWERLTELEHVTPEAIAPYLETSMNIKQKIVLEDFQENNIRKILNFGHTVGHAVETSFLKDGTPIPHGEAVAIGMICETHLAFLKKIINESLRQQITDRLLKYFPVINLPFKTEDIVQVMKNDKKNKDGKILFSLIDQIGSGIYNIECEEDQMVEIITFYKQMFKK